nr:MAG TPA: hypothetical protein [Caudoviricetes sp.]
MPGVGWLISTTRDRTEFRHHQLFEREGESKWQ